MAQQTLNREQETQRIYQDYSYLYRYLRGFILVVFGIWLGSMFFSDTEGYATNVFTELIGIIATYLIFDEITKRANKRELREQLLADLKSTSVAPAVNALDRLRRENWIDDDYFIGKDLQRANWEGAYIGGLNFENANLQAINLKNVSVFDGQQNKLAIFKSADLRFAYLEGAYLREAHLEGAILNEAHLEGAYLRRAHFEGAILNEAHLEGAILNGAYLEGAHLFMAHLEGVDLRGAHFEGAHLIEAHLEGAHLIEAHLEGAHLWGAHFEGAHLNAAHLEGAYLQKVHFEGAHLQGAYLENVKWSEEDKYPATLPDGTQWTPEEDLRRFTNPQHPDYQATLAKINAIRTELGYDPIE